jgi:APA family basic amino acid/polyamine antiporter
MLAALWAYDGWCDMAMVAGEVRDPERNIARALGVGCVLVVGVYCVINAAYLYALPLSEVASSNSSLYPEQLPVGTKAAQTFLGSFGSKLVTVIFIVSILGSLNGTILTGARVPFAMAQHGLFPTWMGRVSESRRAPAAAIAAQAAWASVLALSASFDQLTNCIIFAYWIFYGLTTTAVFVLRRKLADLPRAYRTPGYPVVPVLFLLATAWLLVSSLQNNLAESSIGLVLILLGVPVYQFFRRRARCALG